MKEISFIRSFLHKAYSSLVMPLGFVAITLVVTNNLPMLSVKSEDLLEADYSPRSRVLGLSDSLAFQRFVFLRTHFVMSNQCSIKPEVHSVIQKDKVLY
jgi:hypothetical protein